MLFAIAAADLLSRIGPSRARHLTWSAACAAVLALDISAAYRFDDYSRLTTARFSSRPFAGSADSARTVWTQAGDDIRAYEYLFKQSDLCGLVDGDAPWFLTPGYFHLHKPILIEFAGTTSSPPNTDTYQTHILPRWEKSAANYLVAPHVHSDPMRALIDEGKVERMAEFGEVAVFRKRGKPACAHADLITSLFVEVPHWLLEQKGILKQSKDPFQQPYR